tara:strand:- start:227 stop:361 length:135 start_codon:yes stop_codon:yes gene_type:complete
MLAEGLTANANHLWKEASHGQWPTLLIRTSSIFQKTFESAIVVF